MKLKKKKKERTKSPAGFLDSEPLVKGFRIASAAHQPPAAVFLSSSPGDRRRARGRGSKGEAFVTRMRYEHPLAGAAGPAAPRAQRHRQGEGLRKTAPACSVLEGAPEPPRGERPHLPRGRSDQWKSGKGAKPLRQGCARGPQALPAGDEREGANLEQPDTGNAGGAPERTGHRWDPVDLLNAGNVKLLARNDITAPMAIRGERIAERIGAKEKSGPSRPGPSTRRAQCRMKQPGLGRRQKKPCPGCA